MMCVVKRIQDLSERAKSYADRLNPNNKIVSIIYNLYQEFWKLRPEVQKVLYREMTFVLKDHQRQGIAQYLQHLGLNFDQLRESGIDGIFSEASSNANQTLLKKMDTKSWRDPKGSRFSEEYIRSNGDKVVIDDGTSSVKLVYLNLHNVTESSH